MKKMKLSLAFGLLFTVQFSQAQTKEENSDSTKIKLGKDTELIIIDNSKKNKEYKQNDEKNRKIIRLHWRKTYERIYSRSRTLW